jgi:hypothetical protein
MSSCTASDDALLKWILAKRKMIIQKYGTPGGNAISLAALLSDVSHDDPRRPTALDMLTVEECTDV